MSFYFYDEQKIEKLRIKFQCKCGNQNQYESWDENMMDNPYVDVECDCGIYYKKRNSIAKNGGKELEITRIGKFL